MSSPTKQDIFSRIPRITLVGAGPGDPDLLTLKGMKALQSADVVLYDALANDALLAHAPAHAVRLYVGKRAGSHYMQQEEINQAMVSHARQYGHVVRLKGGDPYVFGRGHEEQVFAENAGIPTTVVPGISSAYAVPALQGIPLTQPKLSDSFWVVTGTTRSGQLSDDMHLAAQSNATIVVLMGMTKLQEIQEIFSQQGKSDMPVAIIQHGSTPHEKVGTAQVHDMVAMAAREQLSSPAIIVIGRVAALHASYTYTNKPLPGFSGRKLYKEQPEAVLPVNHY